MLREVLGGILNWESWKFVRDKQRCSNGWGVVHRMLREVLGGLVNVYCLPTPTERCAFWPGTMGKRKFEFKRYDYHNVEDSLNKIILDELMKYSTVKWYPSSITVTNTPTTITADSISSGIDLQMHYNWNDWRDLSNLSSTSSFYYDFSAEPIAITTDSNTNNVSVSIWE